MERILVHEVEQVLGLFQEGENLQGVHPLGSLWEEAQMEEELQEEAQLKEEQSEGVRKEGEQQLVVIVEVLDAHHNQLSNASLI